MTKFKKLFIPLLLVAVSAPFIVFAEVQAENSAERLARTCSMCHGTNGATPGEHSPIIGGQLSSYLQVTMNEYADETRTDSAMMKVVAKGFTKEQISEIAKVFESKKWIVQNQKIDAELAEKGKILEPDNGCNGCHGENGIGMDENPRIAGQNIEYLKMVMKRYQTGERKSADMEFMKELSEADMAALAEYYGSIK